MKTLVFALLVAVGTGAQQPRFQPFTSMCGIVGKPRVPMTYLIARNSSGDTAFWVLEAADMKMFLGGVLPRPRNGKIFSYKNHTITVVSLGKSIEEATTNLEPGDYGPGCQGFLKQANQKGSYRIFSESPAILGEPDKRWFETKEIGQEIK